MGEKGSKMQPQSEQSAKLVQDMLQGIEGISFKKMFGGFGFFFREKMFLIVDSKGKVFLKASGKLKDDMVEAGSIQHSRMPYYSVDPHSETVHNLNLIRRSLDLQ